MRRIQFLEQRSLVEVPGADVNRFPADQSGGRRQALRQASAETGSTRGVSAEYCTCGQKLRLIDAASFERNVFDARYCIHGSSVRACPNECRIFVGRLPHQTIRDHIRDYFSEFGTIRDIILPLNRANRLQNQGYGFVVFAGPWMRGLIKEEDEEEEEEDDDKVHGRG